MKWLYYVLGLLYFPAAAAGQQMDPSVTISTGGYHALEAGSLDFSLGEWMTEPLFASMMIEQGCLHGFDIPHDELTGLSTQIKRLPASAIWPNPADQSFRVSLEDYVSAELVLIDHQGKICHRWNLHSAESECQSGHLPSGTYMALVKTATEVKGYSHISITH